MLAHCSPSGDGFCTDLFKFLARLCQVQYLLRRETGEVHLELGSTLVFAVQSGQVSASMYEHGESYVSRQVGCICYIMLLGSSPLGITHAGAAVWWGNAYNPNITTFQPSQTSWTRDPSSLNVSLNPNHQTSRSHPRACRRFRLAYPFD